MSTATEKISFSQGLTSYRVKVQSFKHKMNTWKNGRRVFLKEFIVDGISLILELYPNGNIKENVKHVSLFIENRSGVDIDILFDLNIGEKVKYTDMNFSIEALSNWGYGKFYNHENEKIWNEEDDEYGSDDSDFEITLTVKKLWKQFHVNAVKSHESNKLKNVEQRLESLENSVKSLLAKNEAGHEEAPRKKMKLLYPECPICLENMTHETRIMQCYGGHPMCGVCHDKLETKICPSCKMGMIGRNHGMESYLRTLFSDQNGNPN